MNKRRPWKFYITKLSLFIIVIICFTKKILRSIPINSDNSETPKINEKSFQYLRNPSLGTADKARHSPASNQFNLSLSLAQKMYPDFENCSAKILKRNYIQRGDYWIFQNYVPASKTFKCNESITYATHGEIGYLFNLIELAARWQGPLSVAVYAVGTTFKKTLDVIFHLRECGLNDVKKLVTFHLIFNSNHLPKQIPSVDELLNYKIKCEIPLDELDILDSYKYDNGLGYPANVARNVAKSNSATYFVFSSDIELYPSVHVIPEFLKMLERPDASSTSNKRVYVLPVFEVHKNEILPKYKEKLISLLESKRAHIFHERLCQPCHKIPRYKEWVKLDNGSGLSVFTISERKFPNQVWEPIFIGTEEDPNFDERLTYEGKAEKMVQNYIMCLMNYEYHVLDNAFLVHRSTLKKDYLKVFYSDAVHKQNLFIMNQVKAETDLLFGRNKDCYLI